MKLGYVRAVSIAVIGILLCGGLIGCAQATLTPSSRVSNEPGPSETPFPPTSTPPPAPTATSAPTAMLTATPLPDGMIAVYLEQERQTIREVGGGNFVHWPHSTSAFEPVSEFNLQALNPAVVRARMSLDSWEPKNDDADPNHISEDGFIDEGPNRYTFEMLQRFQNEGKLIVVSAWDLPDWMIDFPESADQRKIKMGIGEEVAETIVAWLRYARNRYGVKVSYISFNEADGGYHVSLSSDEYAQLIRTTAPRLQAENLDVKWLLGDTANMGSAYSYARGIWSHEDIRPYLGPLAFHSWDATAQDTVLEQLGDFATQEGLEVWCTEAGYAAFLWQRPEEFPTWENAQSLAAVYLRVLKLTRATTLLYWEMMAQDYPLNDGKQPYPALQAIQMLQEYFPAGAIMLETSTDPTDIKWTAARLVDGSLAVVMLNRDDAPRELTIRGLPAGVYRAEMLSANGPELSDDLRSADTLLPVTVAGKSILFLRTELER
jgi:hypothetical protein